MNQKSQITSPSYRLAFILITSLFFMWGLSYGLMDVLNKYFQNSLNISHKQGGLVHAAYFSAYFCISIPAGLYMEKRGYKQGIILGLTLYAIGALLFIPATAMSNFYFFLFALFTLALGLGCLETASNPYSTALGPSSTSEVRLNLSQSFNGLGQFIGPIIGGLLFFKSTEQEASNSGKIAVVMTYIVIAIIVISLIFLFKKVHLPDLRDTDIQNKDGETTQAKNKLFSHKEFIGGIFAHFFYISAQVGIAALFINLTLEHWPNATSKTGALLLSIAMLLLMIGRFLTTGLMTKIEPRKILAIYALMSAILMIIVVLSIPYISVLAALVTFFFISIMFPTIFALGVKNLGNRTKIGSSCIMMAIVGGAIMPTVMNLMAHSQGVAISYLLPCFCFMMVFLYALFYKKLSR